MTATEPKHKIEPATVQESKELKFRGPANKEFITFVDQANYFLNEYWPNWKNYDNPQQSYIFPPVFKFKHQDVSDEAFKKFEKTVEGKEKIHKIVNDRRADEAEFLIYDAIQRQLIDDRSIGPFIAIRNLNLRLNYDKEKRTVTGLLTKIFPNIDWIEFRHRLGRDSAEYDFLLIGPKIGIAVIEVKSSNFDGASDFKEKSLPNDYKKGLNQLHSSIALINLLQECTGLEPKRDIRKILFAPNLDKKRYDSWFDSLDESAKINVKNKIGPVVQWFKELEERNSIASGINEEKSRTIFKKDVKTKAISIINCFKETQQNDTNAVETPSNPNQPSNKNHISAVLKRVLQTNSLDNRIYESYCPILTAISSANLSSQFVEMDKYDFSDVENAAILNSCLEIQNPLKDEKSNKKPSVASGLKQLKIAGVKQQPKDAKNVYCLTPDQQTALNGPRRQLILGVAGTGKTVVLQTKAIELLAKGESVLVIAAIYFASRYERLIDSYGFKNGTVLNVNQSNLFSNMNGLFFKLKPDSSMEDIEKFVVLNLKSPECAKLKNLFEKYDNILIDDTGDNFSDQTNQSRCSEITKIFLLMTILNKLFPNKLIWFAVDPISNAFDNNRFLRSLFESKIRNQRTEMCDYEITNLKRVLRCTGNIFDFVYRYLNDDSNPDSLPEQLLPVLGHKITGIKRIKPIEEYYETIDEAKSVLQQRTYDEIEKLLDQNVASRDIVVIVDGFGATTILSNMMKTKRLQISVHLWNYVSSLEWPFVIFVSFWCNKHGQSRFSKYRAISRSTTQLIDISVTYNHDRENFRKWTTAETTELIKIDRDPGSGVLVPSTIIEIVNEFYENQLGDYRRNEIDIERKLLVGLNNEDY